MKIGVLFCSYGLPISQTMDSLVSWQMWKEHFTQFETVISAVSVPFKNFPYIEDTETKLYLSNEPNIDYLFDSAEPLNEWDARNLALAPLLKESCDIIIPVDGDELWGMKEIDSTLSFVESNPFVTWFKVAFRNFVFDSSTFLAEPFWGNRIFRTKSGEFELDKFYHDCEVRYKKKDEFVDFKNLPNSNVPQPLVWIDHLAWLDETSEEKSRSLAKVRYQESRGWQSHQRSFVYSGGLKFNPEFAEYKQGGFPKLGKI